MPSKNKKLIQNAVSVFITTLGISGAQANAADLPRGANVHELAGNCEIGTFPQTTKAGPYNSLCHVMKDSEKCLALIKGQFFYNGQEVEVTAVPEQKVQVAKYCLEVLNRELGLKDN